MSRSYDAIITDATLMVAVFGALLRIPFTRRPRHLLLECLWEYPSGWLNRTGKSIQFRCAVSPWSRAVVYARRERKAFRDCFRVPASRFVFIPYHSTLHWFTVSDPPPRREYVFAGGESQRDYHTLLAAATTLNVRVVIALRNPALLHGLRLPPNVEIVRTDHHGFLELMRGALVNVVPLRPGTLRSAGHQTFLNAMAFGTAVVVTDPEGASDYIDNWRTGVVTPAGDVKTLSDALQRLLADSTLRGEIGRAAAQAAARFSTTRILTAYMDFVTTPAFDDPMCESFPTLEHS